MSGGPTNKNLVLAAMVFAVAMTFIDQTIVAIATLDRRGTLLVTSAMALAVLGLQQSSSWGWSSAATWGCIFVGSALMVAFVAWERRTAQPLLRLDIFKDRGFSVDTAVLALASVAFLPFFFFASVYAQASLGKTASNAGEYILYFFLGYVIASLIGGRMLDRRGARPPIVIGSALAAVGFYLLAGKLTDLSLSAQTGSVMLAGAGIGLMFIPASADAVNRASRASYSEVTGITQTARYFGASVGLAALGTILLSETKTRVTDALTGAGVPRASAEHVAGSFASAAPPAGSRSGASHALVHDVELAFARSAQPVFYAMAGVLALTFLLALTRMPRGRLEAAPVIAPGGEHPPGAVTAELLEDA